MTSFVDAAGRTTTFGYNTSGLLTSISAPGSIATSFTYDSSARVTSVTQLENAAGGPGSSVTRLAYISGTETQVASPVTDQAQPVTAVPHTTYSNINADELVQNVKDAQNRPQAKTYNPVNQATATGSVGLTGSDSTVTNTYGANGGESLTKSTTNGGLEMTMSYANPAGPTQYAPTGSKDAGNVSQTYEYTGTGNPASSTGQGGTEKASLDYNPDGTVSAAASPKSDTNKTQYGYNTDKQMTSITPKTGSTLGVQNLTYDGYGRVRTATNGRGITATYSYDKLDRMTGTTFTGGMSVAYGYDAGGRNNTRTDPNGTTTYGYDQLGRLTSRKNTFGTGETFTYAYNKAGWLTQSDSVSGGPVTYEYDDAGKLKTLNYVSHTGYTKQMIFYTDSHNRRTEAWLASDPDRTNWVAHYKYSYDKNDRVIRVVGEQGSGTASHTDVIDITYCYKQRQNTTFTTAPKPGGNCTLDDKDTVPVYSKLQWQKNNLTGKITRYSYKQNGKIDTVWDVNADGSDNTKIYDYDYDGNGNRLQGDHNGAEVMPLTFNPENQITTTGYTYDGTGNLTTKPGLTNITYTAADQLASVTKPGSSSGATTYTYTHAGADNNELLQQTTPEGTYDYAYGRPNQHGVPTIETTTKDGQTANVINDPTTGQPLMLRTSTGMQSMYIYDGTPGSPIALITSAAYQAFAYEYDPYGLPTLTANSGGSGVPQNPFLFAGGIQDRTTGWVHYGNRYYDPTTGTWTQRDTLDNPLSPLNANRYAYAGGDPINNTDPTGYSVVSCPIAVAGFAFATVTFAASIPATGGWALLATGGYLTAGAGVVDACY